MELTAQHCKPCEGDEAPMTAAEADARLPDIPDWSRRDKAIERVVDCGDFQTALDHVVAIGELAEQEGHHPDLHIEDYKTLRIVLSTHAIGGLSMNDFILAAKIDERL